MSNPGTRTEFVEPAGLTDAEARRRKVAEEISDIAAQLNARKHKKAAKFLERHPNGTKGSWEVSAEERKENVEYGEWRKKALDALRARERVLRQLNDWIKAERRRLHTAASQSQEEQDISKLLNDAYLLFVKLREDDVEFDTEEWALVEKLRGYLDTPKKENTTAA